MPAINGSLLILRYDDPGAPGTHVPVPCQLDTDVTVTVGEIVTTCKDDDWKTVIGGEASWSLTTEMIRIPADAIQEEMIRSALAREIVPVEFWEDGVLFMSGDVLVTSLGFSMPKQDVAKHAISMTGSGALVIAP